MLFVSDDAVVCSLVGAHAGETIEQILNRKMRDIKRYGKTFWLVNSHQINPVLIQKICKEDGCLYCYFALSSEGSYNANTKMSVYATDYSTDYQNWEKIPDGFSHISGRINKNTSALVFDCIEKFDSELDMWSYRNYKNPDKSLKSVIGGSTFCGIKSTDVLEGMKSRYRKIVYRARFVEPFCLFLK